MVCSATKGGELKIKRKFMQNELVQVVLQQFLTHAKERVIMYATRGKATQAQRQKPIRHEQAPISTHAALPRNPLFSRVDCRKLKLYVRTGIESKVLGVNY